jgi:hypothetical protein
MVFNEYCRKQPTAHVRGPFIRFVKATHSVALGGDRPAPSTLERLAKVFLKRRRETGRLTGSQR